MLSGLSTQVLQFAVLQAVFVVLGPEDPFLKANEQTQPPFVLAWRCLPALAMTCNLLFFTFSVDAGTSNVTTVLQVELLVFVGCASFWLGDRMQRFRARDVLLRQRFWGRVWRLIVLPFILLGSAQGLADYYGTADDLFECFMHVATAAACAVLIQRILSGQDEAYDRSPVSNPLVVHWLLYAPLISMTATLVFTLGFDGWAHGWRWPTLSMAATTPASACVLRLSTPILVAAAASAIWIMSAAVFIYADTANERLSIAEQHSKFPSSSSIHWRVTFAKLGASCGMATLCFGIGASFLAEGSPTMNIIHDAFSIGFFGSLYGCLFMFVFASDLRGIGGILRMLTWLLLTSCMACQLVLFLLVNQIVANGLNLPHSFYASSEYLSLLLTCALPATWAGEVQYSDAPVLLPFRRKI